MSNDVVLKVDGLSKKFCRSLKRSMFYGSVDITRDLFGVPYNSSLRPAEFWALEDINFEVKRGETFGLIGANGSGKSTLLRLINGIFPPDKGKIEVKGRIGALIAVGAGFHPHMTGRENIFLNGVILGMTRQEINQKFDAIVDFADIGNFLDSPVSTYSSGMYVRLGFAIAIHSQPDIVLVDEVLSVGDAKFQRKCLEKIKEMRNMGVTFFLVSHNMQNIEAMCDRTLFLRGGKQVAVGPSPETISKYELSLQTGIVAHENVKQPRRNGGLKCIFKYEGFGTEDTVVKKITVTNPGSKKLSAIDPDKKALATIELTTKIALNNVFVWIAFIYINDRQDDMKNYVSLGARRRTNIPAGTTKIVFEFSRLGLPTGEYKIGFFIFDETFTLPHSQGYYGYIHVTGKIPTMLRVGFGTPLYWADPKIQII